MIHFRCWYCNRRYKMTESRIGESFMCSCKVPLRIPKRDGGACRIKTLMDWLVEAVVYGGGGALLGFGFAVLIFSRVPFRIPYMEGMSFTGALTVVGFLFGLFGGERGINWIGGMIREREYY